MIIMVMIIIARSTLSSSLTMMYSTSSPHFNVRPFSSWGKKEFWKI